MPITVREAAAAKYAKRLLDESVSWPPRDQLGPLLQALSAAVVRESVSDDPPVPLTLAETPETSDDVLKGLLSRWTDSIRPSLSQHSVTLPSVLERVLTAATGEVREAILCLLWWYLYQKQQVATREKYLQEVLYGDMQHMNRSKGQHDQDRPDDQAAAARVPDAV